MLLLKLCTLLVITLRRKIGRATSSILKLINLLAKRRRKFRRRTSMSRAKNQLSLVKLIRVRFPRKKKKRRRKVKNLKTKLSVSSKKRRSQVRRLAKRKYSLKSPLKKKLLSRSLNLKVLNNQRRKRNLKRFYCVPSDERGSTFKIVRLEVLKVIKAMRFTLRRIRPLARCSPITCPRRFRA